MNYYFRTKPQNALWNERNVLLDKATRLKGNEYSVRDLRILVHAHTHTHTHTHIHNTLEKFS